MDDTGRAVAEQGGPGFTELRIHGVSGTAPAVVLNDPFPQRVAGDTEAGFYRPWSEGRPPGGPKRFQREAYGWGGLTSGPPVRALWLLLLPFMLVNVGFFTAPRPADDERRRLRRLGESVQRLFALSLTGTLILTVVAVSVDLVGWQCTARGGACRVGEGTTPGWLSLLAADRLEPAGRLAVTSLLPVLVIALVWWLGNSTWRRHELRSVPARTDETAEPGTLLARRALWNGHEPVGRLRSLHVAFGFLLVTLAVAGPFTGRGVSAAAVVVAVAGLLLASVVVLTAWHGSAARAAPRMKQTGESETKDPIAVVCVVIRWAAIAVWASASGLALSGVFAADRDGNGSLPWFVPMVGVLVAVQYGLLVALTAVGTIVARTRPAKRAAGSAAEQSVEQSDWVYQRALRGLGPPAAAALAWLLAGGFSAGLTFRVADFLGKPVPPANAGASPDVLVVPDFYWWAAATVPVFAVVFVVAAGIMAGTWAIRRRGLSENADLRRAYDTETPQVARTWAAAALTDGAGLVAGWMVSIFAVLLAVAAGGYLTGQDWPYSRFAWLTTAGSWGIGLFALTLLVVGRNAYRKPQLRRTIGILWDIGTFWPRVVHPLAPPCYGERVFPDLISRVGRLTKGNGGTVVLSGHSQGSVIAAALILQLDPETRRKVRLLTCGSPLCRLYQRFFPAYFGPSAIAAIRDSLTAHPDQKASSCQWINLYRGSDPIGGPVACRRELTDLIKPPGAGGADGDIDRFLWDPFRTTADDAPAPICGHDDYFTDPAYAESLVALMSADHRTAARPASGTSA